MVYFPSSNGQRACNQTTTRLSREGFATGRDPETFSRSLVARASGAGWLDKREWSLPVAASFVKAEIAGATPQPLGIRVCGRRYGVFEIELLGEGNGRAPHLGVIQAHRPDGVYAGLGRQADVGVLAAGSQKKKDQTEA
jgi:hypothetical protein